MHVPRIEVRSLDDTVEAADLGQTPADVVFLSYSDSDLVALQRAYEAAQDPKPTMRLASLGALRHPYSVDLYLERVCVGSRLIVIRVLGGAEYWRYGVDELAAFARRRGVKLALVPGDRRADKGLESASTLPSETLTLIWRYFDEGGPRNMQALIRVFGRELGADVSPAAPEPVEAFGRVSAGCFPAAGGAPNALLVFYRSIYFAGDFKPILALAEALAARGFATTAVFVTSLKDGVAAEPLRALIARESFDVILNATAFSGRLDDGQGTVLDLADAPVLQVAVASASLEAWQSNTRGLSPADLAMHVALPEIDGRILTRAVSFKAAASRHLATEFAAVFHEPLADRIDFVADLAGSWAKLRRTDPAEKRLALVLPDYPARLGRTGYAVGLDTPASAIAIAEILRRAGYDVGAPCEASQLIAALSEGPLNSTLTLAGYERLLAKTPASFRIAVSAAWGDPASDPGFIEGAFRFRFVRLGKLAVAVQPDRGDAASRKGDYHDLSLAPRHAYVAFHLWLTHMERVHAVIALGAHGTLEWLPGKAVALSRTCAPEILIGATPVVYPFIVNNPGEAGQAKRRIGAVTIGHLTPPLVRAGSQGATLELEGLFDEYAEAQGLDPRRAKAIGKLILERGAETGLLRDCNAEGQPAEEALAALDGWLCDLKDMRIGDGLHVFGRSPESAEGFHLPSDAEGQNGGLASSVAERVAACGAGESLGLLRALAGHFVPPGPGGAPARGRLDVLPTGRNLYSVDPRAVPTRNAWEIGRRAAEAVVARFAQDRGDWPKRIVLDLWGSATTRTGGDELAQAFALLGCRPMWDVSSNRVSGYEILPLAMLGRPRVDVTLRISGLFRDIFPTQIALFSKAARAVAALDEGSDDNPLVAADGAVARIFGAPPGAYGVGLGREIAEGGWSERSELAEAYLAATSFAYDGDSEGREAASSFREIVGATDAFVHAQDLPGQDALDADALSEHEGGFAAAAQRLGAAPALYHLDTTAPETPKVRTLAQEIARALRGRAANPRWIAGQMRHGHRGAAEIAQALDNLFAFAALTDAVHSAQFDLLFDATLGEEPVRAFLLKVNPQAARHMAKVFEDARRRGFWVTRRNSSAAALADIEARVA